MGGASRLWAAVLLISALLGATLVWAGEARAQEGGEISTLEARIGDRNSDLARAIDEVATVGARLEETQSRVDGIRARAEDLRAQRRDLEGQLASQRRSFAAAKARHRERMRAAYRGQDLSGLSFLLERFLGVSGETDGRMDLRVLHTLLDGGDALDAYQEQSRLLRDTVRQVSRKESAYDEVLRREARLTEDLRSQERELERSVRRIGEQRSRMQTRLRGLRAAERARILRKKPATSSVVVEPSGPTSSTTVDGGIEEVGQDRWIGRRREIEIARQEIVARPVESPPAEGYMALYRRAAAQYGFGPDWYVLAAVGRVESDHGQAMGPSTAGAMGPMQFLPYTWETAGVDGNGDGVANIMDPEDAIPAAASYLRAGGAPGDWYAALYSYNHADWYVAEVLAVAEGYRQLAGDDSVGPYL